MNSEMGKTPRGRGLGFLESDTVTVRRYVHDLGWTAQRLADKAGLSQQMISAFLNGKRKLSSAASDRVLAALQAGFLEKKATDELWQKAARDLDPTDPLFNLKLLAVPRDPAKYEEWKARNAGKQYDYDERARNAELEKELSHLREINSNLEKIKSNSDEIISLYGGYVERLKKQLRDAGITPTD